jgi:hypothetical protein
MCYTKATPSKNTDSEDEELPKGTITPAAVSRGRYGRLRAGR